MNSNINKFCKKRFSKNDYYFFDFYSNFENTQLFTALGIGSCSFYPVIDNSKFIYKQYFIF